MKNMKNCPCGSRRKISNCCEKFLNLTEECEMNYKTTLLLGWIKKYAPPIRSEFMQKMKSYIFRLSYCLDVLVERYLYFGLDINSKNDRSVDDTIYNIKHNTLLSIFAGLTCLEQGLFMQSGILFRSIIENCMVIIDVCEHENQMDKLLKDKYSVNGLVGRVKRLIPDCMVNWYGYFSTNFTHFGPLHSAPIIPRMCWPDNWLLVTGIQNVTRACFALGITLEKIHFDIVSNHFFWERKCENKEIVFIEDGPIWEWLENFREDIVSQYPPGEKRDGFTYSDKTYKLK